jgi:hypothetical protein
MDEDIQFIKISFNKIKDIRTQVMLVFHALEIKLTKLKITTNEFIRANKDNIFIFGLDSFQFQCKLIDYEYSDMQKFYFALNNRMYCEYYKLYKLILNYTEETIGTNKNIEMLKSQNVFPIYKDLEPFKQYNFETIEEIHKTIINLLNNLNDHIIAKELQLHLFHLKQKSGLNINNFVNTFDFDIIVIKQKCLLYLSYLDFLHNIHTKHFKRFSRKMKLMNDYLDEDIKFDEGMNAVEDDGMNSNDSIKSSTSNSSLDTVVSPKNNNDIVNDNKASMKSVFKSNVKKVINSLRITKPDNSSSHISDKNISPQLSSVNINQMLDTLTNSFDTRITSPRPKYETMFSLSSKSQRGLTDSIKLANIPVDNPIQIGDKSDTIYAVVSDLSDTKDVAIDALILSQSVTNHETIYAHDLNKVATITESIIPPIIGVNSDTIYDHNLKPIEIKSDSINQPIIGDNTNILSKAKKKQNQKKKQKKKK